MICATIPIPPSTNNLFFTLKTGRRAKTQAYKDWQRITAPELLTAYVNAGRPHFPPKSKMALTVRVGMKYTGDISNRIKALEDLLVAALPIPDDRYIDHISITRDLTIEGFAHVTLEALA